MRVKTWLVMSLLVGLLVTACASPSVMTSQKIERTEIHVTNCSCEVMTPEAKLVECLHIVRNVNLLKEGIR